MHSTSLFNRTMTVTFSSLSKAAAVLALTASVAAAQSGRGSDFSGPGGLGGGTGGAVAPLGVPSTPIGSSIRNGANIFSAAQSLSASLNQAGGVQVPGPAGTVVTVPPAAGQAIAAALNGSGGPLVTQLQAAGIPSDLANALAGLLAGVGQGAGSGPGSGGTQTGLNANRLGQLQAAVRAYNAAIAAGPSTPAPVMAGVRFALAALSRAAS